MPTRTTTQGSLNIIPKEDIVNKTTTNFNFSERHDAFTENEQEFLKSVGFNNSIGAEIKQGKINILPAVSKLADLSVVPPTESIYHRQKNY